MKNNDLITLLLRFTVPTDRQKGPSWLDLEPSGDPFWEPFWDQIGPRGAKMSPRGPSRAPKYRKPTTPKKLKNNVFFKVFGGPRSSKTSYKDPKRLPRGYLGLLEAILSHLGAILKTRAFKRAPVGSARATPSPRWPILGRFGTIWGLILGAILGPNRPKRSQNEPKRAIKSPKVPKTYNTKNLKKPFVF